MIKKLISSLLITATLITVLPISASAAWKQDSTGWWYTQGNNYSVGWQKIDGAWYYFDSNGYMKTGWLQDNGKWYYLVSTGMMKTSWVQDGSTWYYLDDNGAMVTGKVSVNNKVYEFNNNGKWIDTSTTNSNTAPANNTTVTTSVSRKPSDEKFKSTSNYSWFEENGHKYFKVDDDGCLLGTWNIDGSMYFFDKDGVMQTGDVIMDNGSKYMFGSNGVFLQGLAGNVNAFADSGITTKSTTESKEVKLKEHIISSKLKGRTLTCRIGETIRVSSIEVTSAANENLVPKLLVRSESSNKDVASGGIEVFGTSEHNKKGSVDIYVNAFKPGKSTITIYINGTKTSFDVIVAE